ncbi:MAG: ABC transporter permease [Clostridia bacterium]|nr:ABC transporter permease [Clostridia bacterium]
MNKSVLRVLVLTKRNLKELIRDPLSLVFMILLPLTMEILFYYLFHNATSQFEMKYLAPGIVVFSQSFSTLFTGLLIALDRSTAFLTRLYVTKTKSFEFIFGYLFSILPTAILQAILFYIVGGVIDPSLFGVGMLLAIVFSVITGFFFIGFGIFLGSVCNEKSIGGISSIVIAGQSVLSGMWFPTEGLPDGFIVFMKCLPFKNATDLISISTSGISGNEQSFLVSLAIVCAYAVAVILLGIIFFKRQMTSK